MSYEPIELKEKARELLQAAVAADGLGRGHINRIRDNDRLLLIVGGETYQDLGPGDEQHEWDRASFELAEEGLVESADHMQGEVFRVTALGYKVAEEQRQMPSIDEEFGGRIPTPKNQVAIARAANEHLQAKLDILQRSHEELVRKVLGDKAEEFIGSLQAELSKVRPRE